MQSVKLTDYQMECSKKIKEFKHCFLQMETGTGKTYTALMSVEGKTLVICPEQNSKKQWIKSVENVSIDVDVFTYHEMGKQSSIGSYDSVIIDEVHNLLNPTSKRSKNVYRLLGNIKPRFFLCLSYTPINKNEKNLFKMIKSLNIDVPLSDYRTLKHFEEYFFEESFGYLPWKRAYDWGYFNFNESKRFEFMELLNVISYEFTEERFKKNYQKIELIKPSIDKYHMAYKEHVIDEHYTTLTSAYKVSVLRQLSNSTYKDYNEELHTVDDDYKIKLKEINKAVQKHGKIIIVYSFEAELKILKENFKHGTTEVELFEKDEYNILFRQCQKSAAIDIPFANAMVWFSMNYSAVDFTQMHGRITRMNSKFNEVYYYYLVFKNTIEEDLWLIVNNKKKKNDLLTEVGRINE